MRLLKTLAVTALLATVSAPALADDMGMSDSAGMADDMMMAPVMTGKVGDNVFLMDGHKMTLYTFDNDMHGMSDCTGSCAANWPPLTVSAGTDLPHGYGTVARDDGTMQVTYGGHPLYLFIKDTQPGMMKGDGVGGVWHIARP